MVWLGLLILIGLVAVLARVFVATLRTQPVKALILAAVVLGAVAFSMSLGDSGLGSLATSDETKRVLRMLATVAISVAICIGLWTLLNLAVGQAERRWPVFSGLAAGAAGAVFFGILRGNQSVDTLIADPDPTLFGSGSGWLGHLEWPMAGAALFGLGILAAKSIPIAAARVALGAAVGAAAGALIAARTKLWQRPELDWVNAIVLALLGLAIGYALANTRERRIRGAIVGAGLGFGAGAWLGSPFLVTVDTPWINTIVPLALLTAGFSWIGEPTVRERSEFDRRARVFVFLGPALGFLVIALVIPAIRTAVLSLNDRQGDNYIGLENYERLFTASDSFDLSGWRNIFTSNLFFAAIVLMLIGSGVALVSGSRRNGETSWDSGPTSTGAILGGVFLLSFAVLSTLRGTFFNNIWWVITVVSVTTVLGLAVAVLADRATWGENLAKSLIFMPMAISFVGASIVWRLQFQARPPQKNQTGVLNAVWVALGKLSNSGWPRVMIIIALAAALAWSLWRLVGRARSGLPFTGMSILSFALGWFLYRFIGPRLGGFRNVDGEIVPETVQFITETPFNNVWLMVILIWMQTGFAMVIFFAAIKAVPEEFIEAAHVDGATPTQTFFGVTLPTILPTVGVVVTTLIVLVTKVFDIVAVAGLGGRFGNDVLANQMFSESFQVQNIGFGASIAVVMFLLVLPVMAYNVWSMQREEA